MLSANRTSKVNYDSNVNQFLLPQFREKFRTVDQLMCRKFGWKEAWEFQVNGALLQLARRDTVIHVGTGRGKTAVVAGPYALDQNSQQMSILVSPLLALQEDQEDSFDRKFHLPAIALNSLLDATSFTQSMKDILAGRYRVIIISPECLLSQRIRDVLLTNDHFKKQILSIVIDEAHVIAHWGLAFRKKYDSLHIIRNYLPGVPVICLSATLTPRTIRHISLNLDMKEGGFAIINEGNERPDLSIAIRPYRHAANSFRDLIFPLLPPLAPAVLNHPTKIRQFIIFFNSKNEVHEALRVVTSALPPHLASLGLFRPFTARNSPQYRAEVMRRFKSGDVRGLFGTDAVGMGCDVGGIHTVIQWGVVPLSVLLQHWRRAARGEGETGLAVLLVPPAAYKFNPTEPGPTQATPKAACRQSKSRTKRQMKEPLKKGAWQSSIPGDQPEIREDSPYEEPIVDCCTNCSPALADQIEPPKKTRNSHPQVIRRPKQGVPHHPTQVGLTAWRNKVWARDYPGVSWGPSVVLSDDLVDLLSSVGRISKIETLKRLLDEWGWWETYGDELAQVVYALDPPFMPAPPCTTRAPKRKPVDPDFDPSASASTPTDANAQAPAAKQARSTGSFRATKLKPKSALGHTARATQKTQQDSSLPSSSSKGARARVLPQAWTPVNYPQPMIPQRASVHAPLDQSQPMLSLPPTKPPAL